MVCLKLAQSLHSVARLEKSSDSVRRQTVAYRLSNPVQNCGAEQLKIYLIQQTDAVRWKPGEALPRIGGRGGEENAHIEIHQVARLV